MTAIQIAAILSLLVAFNVPQPTVDEVHTILTNSVMATNITVAPPTETDNTTKVSQTPSPIQMSLDNLSPLQQSIKVVFNGCSNGSLPYPWDTCYIGTLNWSAPSSISPGCSVYGTQVGDVVSTNNSKPINGLATKGSVKIRINAFPTKVIMNCPTASGPVESSFEVDVDETGVLNVLYAQEAKCLLEGGPITRNQMCVTLERHIKSLGGQVNY